MPGKIKELIDELIDMRCKSNPGLAHFVRANLVLNGIDPDRYDSTSKDDQDIVDKLKRMISDFQGHVG